MKKLLIFLTLINIIYASEIGKFSLVKGDVSIQRQQNIIKAKSGDIIYNKDIINTSNISKAQIRFKDGTIVTLGKNTNFNIDNYIYEKENKDVKMSVNNGSFKVITGSIGKLARDNFKFKANSTTIGIRGTIFAGSVSHTNHIIACVEGAIVVSTKNEAKQIIAGKMIKVTNNKLGDIKPLQTKDIETISSLDSKKLNEEIKLTSNEENKSNSSLSLTTNNDTSSTNKQTNLISSNQIQNSSSTQKIVSKTTEQTLEDIKKIQEQIKQESNTTALIPLAPAKPSKPTQSNPSSPTLNDKNNSVFYYGGMYTATVENVERVDFLAKAKVDYTKGSSASLQIKQNAYGGLKNEFDFDSIKDSGHYLRMDNDAGDKLWIKNSQSDQTGPYDSMSFQSNTYNEGNIKYSIQMQGVTSTKEEFDKYTHSFD